MSKKKITKEEFDKFKYNIDLWVKQIRREYSGIVDYGKIVEENVGNIEHNYELILELKEEIDHIKYSIIIILDMLNRWVKENKPRIQN